MQNLKRLSRLDRLLTISLCAILLAGCQTTGSDAKINPGVDFCDGASPIEWSIKDTGPTIDQVKQHNAVGKQLCGWGKKDDGGRAADAPTGVGTIGN